MPKSTREASTREASILWVGDWGRRTSFSRISEEVLPKLCSHAQIGILAPPRRTQTGTLGFPKGAQVWHVGDPLPNSEGTWEEFAKECEGDSLSANMKYTVVQISSICRTYGFGWVIFAMGTCDAEWFAGYRQSFAPTKVAVWTPFDYAPSPKAIQNLAKAHKLLTMSTSVLPWLPPHAIAIGHGVSRTFRRVGRAEAIARIGSVGVWSGTLSEGDRIVLNANNYVPRKQFRLTLEAIRRVPDCKLWLHTNIRDPGFRALLEEYEDLSDRLILSMNNQSDEFLCLVYNICQVGLQTSSGEGWSLTNCEHAYLGGTQVVPNFLATAQHFHKVGVTYPVRHQPSTNEAGHPVTIGVGKVSDIVGALRVALGAKHPADSEIVGYLDAHSWDSVAKELKEALLA